MMYKNIRIEENYIVRNILDSSVRRVTGDDVTYRQLSFLTPTVTYSLMK